MLHENAVLCNSIEPIEPHVTLRQASNGQRLFKLVYVDGRGVHSVATYIRNNSPAALIATGAAYAAQRGFAWRPDLAIITNPANSLDFSAICGQAEVQP